MIWAILASGPSMSQALADQVKKLRYNGQIDGVVVVSDAYKLAPWADAMISNDANWWYAHPEAMEFGGRKYTGALKMPHLERLVPEGIFTTSTNSGLQGVRLSQIFGAKKALLFGFDMHGSHFFGKHKAPLKNTQPEKFKQHCAQFLKYKNSEGAIEVVNLTPGSSLKCFPFSSLQELFG